MSSRIFRPILAAIGFNVETVTYKNIKFQVWDLGGQTSIRPYWRCYYPNTQASHGAVFWLQMRFNVATLICTAGFVYAQGMRRFTHCQMRQTAISKRKPAGYRIFVWMF